MSPEIEKVSFDVFDSGNNPVLTGITVNIDKIKEGIHHFWQVFQPCPICHKSLDSAEDRKVGFDVFQWSAVISVIDTDIPIQSTSSSIECHLPKALFNHPIDVSVTGRKSGCSDCIRTKSVTVRDPNG